MALGAVVAAALAGCAGSGVRESDAPNTGLDVLTAPGARGASIPRGAPKPVEPGPNDITALAAQAALDLQEVIDSGSLDRTRKAAGSRAGASGDNGPSEFVGPPAPADLIATAPGSGSANETPGSPEDPLLELARRMAALLRDNRGNVPDAVALAPIEAMQPGVLAEIDSPRSALGQKLTAEERRVLADARDRVLAQPGAANDSLTRTLAKLAPPPALKIERAVLCTRVQGFGRYDPYNTDTFVVGKPIRAIVYIELEGFMSRPARAGDNLDPALSLSDQVSVELSQSLTLFHDPSGLQAWHRPAKSVVDTSRNKRRDFYLIQQIELPATLTVGRYNLKVTVKDITSGSEAEAILPVNVVVDASAVTRLK
jgi:hypothetical protein